jgi:hypothetical protein
MGHVAAPDLPRAGRQELVPRKAWQHPSSSEPGGEARRRRARGCVQAHVLSFLELVREVPDLWGTDSGL